MKSAATTPAELGVLVRAERKARGRTQAWIAERTGYRRQTIADLEAGQNVELKVLLSTLAALGKALAITDARVDVDRLQELFGDDEA